VVLFSGYLKIRWNLVEGIGDGGTFAVEGQVELFQEEELTLEEVECSVAVG
jgi:hypothetical protein